MKNIVWTTQAVCLLGLVVLSGCASTIPPPIAPTLPIGPTRLDINQDQATIEVLHRRLREREGTIAKQKYQIEIMSSQLDALKRIDQDTNGQRRPGRNMRIVAP